MLTNLLVVTCAFYVHTQYLNTSNLTNIERLLAEWLYAKQLMIKVSDGDILKLCINVMKKLTIMHVAFKLNECLYSIISLFQLNCFTLQLSLRNNKLHVHYRTCPLCYIGYILSGPLLALDIYICILYILVVGINPFGC